MKHLKSLFLIALTALTTTAWGAVKCSLTTVPSTLVEAPLLKYADGTTLMQNETLRVLWVFAEEDVDLTGVPLSDLFDMDMAGQLVLKAEAEGAIKKIVWATVSSGGDYAVANEAASFGTAKDYTTKIGSGYAKYLEFVCEDALLSTQYPYLFFVTSDRRASNEAALETGVSRIAQWGALNCGYYDPRMIPGGGAFAQYIFNYPISGLTNLPYPTPTLATVLPQSLEVGGETLTGPALEAYLAPAVEALVSNEDGFTLSGSSTDILSYTLQTKASLDDEWEDFDEFLADNSEKLSDDEKKTLESSSEKCYTCLRVKKSTQIKIPRLPNETQRFYRLKAE